MHTKKVILVKIILRRGSFLLFLKKIKGKQKYEKERQDIHIIRITTTFETQQVNFLIFSNIIR